MRWRTFHHKPGLLAFHHFIGYQWCHLLRHPKGLARTRWLGLMAGWLDYLRWFHAGLRRRNNGSVNPRYGTGARIFWRPPMMLKSKWFHLVFFLFFFSLSHFGLLHFSLVHKMLGGQPVGDAWALFEETNKKGQVIWMVFVGPCDFCDILMCLLAFHPSSQHTRQNLDVW